jgi:hypothetical protein
VAQALLRFLTSAGKAASEAADESKRTYEVHLASKRDASSGDIGELITARCERFGSMTELTQLSSCSISSAVLAKVFPDHDMSCCWGVSKTLRGRTYILLLSHLGMRSGPITTRLYSDRFSAAKCLDLRADAASGRLAMFRVRDKAAVVNASLPFQGIGPRTKGDILIRIVT